MQSSQEKAVASTQATPARACAGAGGGRAQRAALGIDANRSSPAGRGVTEQATADRWDRRRIRTRLRDRARNVTRLERVRICGGVTVTGTGGPTLRVSVVGGQRIAGYAGLSTCGSVWACVGCAAKVAAKRADELSTVMRKVIESGGSAALVTLTMRHTKGDRLGDCWAAVSHAWDRVTSGKQWTADQNMAGMLGWVRVVEVTRGGHGWHVHVHALLAWDRPVSLELSEYVGARMWARWTRALNRHGFESVAENGGLDVRMASLDNRNLADYFTKLAREVTTAYAKEGRNGGQTPFQILADAVEGVADAVEAWWEWEQASRDRRQMTWSGASRDLRKFAGLGKEQKDAEVAAEELGGPDVLALPLETWTALCGTIAAVELLEVVERDGQKAGRMWLTRRGLHAALVTACPRRNRPCPP